MKQAVIDILNNAIAQIQALPEDTSAEVAALQAQVSGLADQLAEKQALIEQIQAHVVDVEGQLASDEAKILAIKAALGV